MLAPGNPERDLTRPPTPLRDLAAFAAAAAALAWRERARTPRRGLALAASAAFVATAWLRPLAPLDAGAEFSFALPAAEEGDAADPRVAALERALESSEQERARLQAEFAHLAERTSRRLAEQGAAIDELAEHASASVDAIARLIARTGIDPERLIANVVHATGLGGPQLAYAASGADRLAAIEPAAGPGGIAAPAPAHFTPLGRLQALRRALAALPLEAPLASFEVMSGFGARRDPFNFQPAMHFGADLIGPLRAPVLAAARGTVSFAGGNGEYGLMVEVDHGYGLRTRYGHLARIEVRAGAAVAARAALGTMGSTGRSTGPHVHYEVLFEGRNLDPMRFIEARRQALRGEAPRRGS